MINQPEDFNFNNSFDINTDEIEELYTPKIDYDNDGTIEPIVSSDQTLKITGDQSISYVESIVSSDEMLKTILKTEPTYFSSTASMDDFPVENQENTLITEVNHSFLYGCVENIVSFHDFIITDKNIKNNNEDIVNGVGSTKLDR